MLDEMIDAALVLLRKLVFLLFSTKETITKLGSCVLTNRHTNILDFNINLP